MALSPELAREWLDPATPTERDEEIVLLQGEPTEAFEWYPVDRAVGNSRNQGSHLIKRISVGEHAHMFGRPPARSVLRRRR